MRTLSWLPDRPSWLPRMAWLSGRAWVENAGFFAVAAGGGLFIAFVSLMGRGHLGLTIGIVALLVGLAHLRAWSVVVATLAYLAVLGDLRRAVTYVFGDSGMDPLLLVGPAVAGVAFASLLATRQLSFRTPLSKLILALMVLMGLQVLNPAQGGLAVGVGGTLFYIVPLCWYWVGSAFGGAQRAGRLLYGSLLLAFLAALLGFYQVYVGFLPFEQHWIDTEGYDALWISKDNARPFSFFPSSQEYVATLSIAAVVCVALLIRRRAYAVLPLLLFFLAAVFLGGSRGPIVKILITGSVLWAVQGRSLQAWAGRFGVALLIAASGALWTLGAVSQRAPGVVPESTLNRQVEGLTNPEESTAAFHLQMIARGVSTAFVTPLGYGLGSTTKAASAFGERSFSTEMDLSNVAVAMGLLGLLLYGAIMALVLLTAFRYWIRARSFLSLALLGVLVVSGGAWLMGGLYFVSTFLWLCIGMLDRCANEEETAGPPAKALPKSRPKASVKASLKARPRVPMMARSLRRTT